MIMNLFEILEFVYEIIVPYWYLFVGGLIFLIILFFGIAIGSMFL
jgi:hypothetical protein